ncbi:protein kinase subdomain-containing protein PKL/ccin4 [Coprinopsis cinerea okayama7|uniref:Protein kinase subdomain-containing protein PKL/ccin4 n=1 Tax=Coprinopsis cinerea (strain Okayama-7 / 130 / ATCC MYA-4618 / FGSC 9003) TaxID=240176 RepID=A8NDD8_COPC7|nr:protein kinase subdomain-containing protein PKL/ccin4 [Coprinopsis cinerea okayama7\|eukprot:XP_001832751.2 protein kinase subdomain-containing protein PKL/ccin4 [Coprinopsis cinerea okayama7\
MAKGLRIASDSIPEHEPATPPPDRSSPIHKFTPTDISDITSHPTVKIGDILHLLANSTVSRLPEPKPGKGDPTPPSSHGHVHPYDSRQFKAPNLYLTREVLDATVATQPRLETFIEEFRMKRISEYDEGEFTNKIVGPLVGIFIRIFAFGTGVSKGWYIAPPAFYDDTSGRKLELDVIIEDSEQVVTAIEMKTPRSCNDSNIRAFSRPVTGMDQKAKEIRDQVGKQGKFLKGLHPKKPFVLHGLSVAPAHLIPLASNGSDCFAIGSDVMNVSRKFPEAVRDVKNWVEYIDKLAAFTLAMVCLHDEYAAKEVGSRFPEQKKQLDELYAAADGCLSPAAAIGSNVTVVPSDQQPETDAISWFSLALKLPEASAVYESHENIVYVHSRWGIRLVIKVFGEQSSYAKELVSYQRLEKLQGKGIPVLYATGTMNARPCLVLSYEGERLCEGPTDDQKATLYPVVKAMHDLDIHHHDLHRRNVVQDSSGKLTLIDFGLSEPCTRKGCEDDWQADEWY